MYTEFVNVHVYIHTPMHTCMHTHMHVHNSVNAHIHISIYLHRAVHMYTYMHIDIPHIFADMHTYKHKQNFMTIINTYLQNPHCGLKTAGKDYGGDKK